LLVGLANSLSSWKTPKGNLLCVWTDGEECMNEYGPNDGLWGARRAVDYVESKGMKIQAVVCLDMIGDKDLSIKIPANGSPTLAKIAVHAARRAGYPDLVSLWDEHVKDDHLPFHEKGYKAIGMIDFDYGPNNSYWHTDADTMDKISVESLLKSGKVVAEMLNILL
jgi:Zn-dependent M28 family amino/carboxypeptidase